MSVAREITQVELIDCSVCLKEVPISEARSEEATDYVLHFCGLECYTKWKDQDEQEEL